MSRALVILLMVLGLGLGGGCGVEPSRSAATLSHGHGVAAARADGAGAADVDAAVGDDGAAGDVTSGGDTTAGDAGADGAEDASVASDVTSGLDTHPDDAPTGDAGTEDAAPTLAPGSWDEPIEVDRWPFVVDDDTTLAPDARIDAYGCAAATGEAGPERVYHVRLEAAGELVAEVAEQDGVDVDVHLLAALPEAGATEAACLARANTRLAVELAAGDYWVVVDSYSNASGVHAGRHRLAIERTIVDAWQVVDVAPGVTWRRKVYADYAGGRQTVNALEVDLAVATVKPYVGDQCLHPSVTAPVHGAIAAVNAGFFDIGPGTCPSLDLVKVDGVVRSTNHLTGAPQRSFGLDADGAPMMAWVDAGADWPDAVQAVGSYPSLVTDGVVRLEPERTSDFFVARHPRTALGLTTEGHLLLVTVDGRSEVGDGMTLAALAQHMVSLGAVQAVNLDGGGSTAMWVRDQSVNGIVNAPSDDGDDDHYGERGVSDLLLVLPREP